MKSKKSHENYTLIDHLFSPGVPESLIQPLGIITAKSGQILEIASYTCKHCQAEIIKNPDRTRVRAYCPNCDHYICDKCEKIRLIQGCKTIDQIYHEICESFEKQSNIGEL